MRQIVDQHCAECHDENEPPVLNGGINLFSLRGTEDNAEKILDRVTRADQARGRMPKSGATGSPGYRPPLSEPEIAALRDWVKGTPSAQSQTPAAPAPNTPAGEKRQAQPLARAFIPLADEVRAIAADLRAIDAARQPFVRYLTLTNLANLRDPADQPVESEDQLAIYRAAQSKLINSVSLGGRIVPPVAVGAGLTKNADREFRHDGGEIIFLLRNGLHDYYLATADGKRLDRVPTEIVQDRKRADVAIINGISCLACHDRGMQYARDESLDKFLDEVGCTAALAEAMPGYTQATEPVAQLYNRFKKEITLETVAAEVGEQNSTFIDRLKNSRVIRGGKDGVQLGSKNSGKLAPDEFRFLMGEPCGTEIILAVASPVQFTDTENLTFAEREVFKSFAGENDLRKALRRGTKGLTVQTADAEGNPTGFKSAPVFTARAVFTVGP